MLLQSPQIQYGSDQSRRCVQENLVMADPTQVSIQIVCRAVDTDQNGPLAPSAFAATSAFTCYLVSAFLPDICTFEPAMQASAQINPDVVQVSLRCRI
jgi:hypothetical protein